ncbi:MAG: 4-hydroxythreonine-4-phosphate dehydrogenase PdxA, partial [Deltaproteobacteria bacterium]
IVKALAGPTVTERCIPVVLGEGGVLERAMDLAGLRLPLRRIARPAEAEGRPGCLELIDHRRLDETAHRWGEVSAANGAAAVHYTQEAGRLALAGEVEAMVSAPLNKQAMHAAGHRYEGHTEILGELTGTRPAMLLLLGQLRVMLLTNHMALRAVCDYLRVDRVLAVAGLNPHAGEAGAFGHEEEQAILPAIAAARAQGIDAVGPFPADTIFLKARDGAYDLTLALYHDQGLMAVKLLGFGALVTLLVGLPLIRTSVGHGTAFDIAGKNRADHRNLLEAIRVASEVALARRGASSPGIAAAFGRAV